MTSVLIRISIIDLCFLVSGPGGYKNRRTQKKLGLISLCCVEEVNHRGLWNRIVKSVIVLRSEYFNVLFRSDREGKKISVLDHVGVPVGSCDCACG